MLPITTQLIMIGDEREREQKNGDGYFRERKDRKVFFFGGGSRGV